MARVTYGPLVTELAGSIGGVTFLQNASGPIAKLRANPTVNPSPDQSTYQTSMAACVAHWPTLSQENKLLWNAWTPLHKHTTPWGIEKTLSGYQWFLSCNLNRYLVYGDFRDSPGDWFAHPPPDAFTLFASADGFRCEWEEPYTPTAWIFVYLSLPLRQSSLKLRRSLFFVDIDPSGGPFSTFGLLTLFQDLTGVTWGDFFADANCSIICRIQNGDSGSGLKSAFTSAIVKIG